MKKRGYVVYEIFPDRFNASSKKEGMIQWHVPVEKKPAGAHQFDFYGGDLIGIADKCDYLKTLGIGLLYMTPIFKAMTNHRYDCVDYFSIDPILGTEKDLKTLIDTCHKNGIRVVLDGVFNHIGMNNPWYKDPAYRDFLNEKNGEITWWGSHKGLPELNLDNLQLRDLLWNKRDSVVQKWTSLGVDDWRLDCAYDVGYDYCKELSGVLKSMGDHDTIGEIWSYPGEWVKNGVLDGVMNYYFRELIKSYLEGKLTGTMLTAVVEKTIDDSKLEAILKSWNVLSSHDTPRVKNDFSDKWKLAVALQFTLPGSPMVYYGEELGLSSETDPYCRQPMPWKDLHIDPETFSFYKKMIALYNDKPALHAGNFGVLEYSNSQLLAFSRFTHDIKDYLVIIINPSDQSQSFQLISRESSLMNGSKMVALHSKKKADICNSMIYGTIEAHSYEIYELEINKTGYSPYKRLSNQ
ncbi:MAG TPA: glycoside hydrolase family 13 protein [Thermotogota bacterium]|nr:glycoside hydrolase family 13 protein [Thermotogota bacterium]HRW34833.1 glycoside hydrolase family 13 protein [Thermotogota bacterium]